MIHSGAIIGAGIPQFRSIVVRFINIPYPYFRSDRLCDLSHVANISELCTLIIASDISETLYPVELLLVWQLPLELQLEEYCSAWKEVLHFGTKFSPGER